MLTGLMDTVATLLQVDAKSLAASLTCTIRETRGEAIVRYVDHAALGVIHLENLL